MEPNDMEFLLGFLAGEGSFFVQVQVDDRYDDGGYTRPTAKIELGELDEDVLEEIRDMLGMGSLGTTRNVLTVSSRDDCLRLIELIDDHLETHESMFEVTQKYESYCKWKDIVDKIVNEDPSLVEVAQMRDEMNCGLSNRKTAAQIESEIQ